MRHVDDAERRARLAVRHALAPSAHVDSPEAATRAMTVLHSTEPATIFMSCWARVPGFERTDLERALYDDRTLVKQLAMRRTLFVFPRDLLPAAWGGPSARVAAAHAKRLAKELEEVGIAKNSATWLDRARREILARLGDGDALSAKELRAEIPFVDESLGYTNVAPRVLTQLGLEARVVRARNSGSWRSSSPEWTAMRAWLGEDNATDLEPLLPHAAYAAIVRRWLFTFGPATETDLVWWLGSTKSAARQALADLEAVPVTLDGGAEPGWLLPDDLEPVAAQEPWVALLPVLDPTTMGWKGRDFYLGPHAPQLFDRNGNAGTTIWVDGRVVGAWVQDDDQVVQLRLIEELSTDARAALTREAARLTEWLDGTRVSTVYPSPLMKAQMPADAIRTEPSLAPPV